MQRQHDAKIHLEKEPVVTRGDRVRAAPDGGTCVQVLAARGLSQNQPDCVQKAVPIPSTTSQRDQLQSKGAPEGVGNVLGKLGSPLSILRFAGGAVCPALQSRLWQPRALAPGLWWFQQHQESRGTRAVVPLAQVPMTGQLAEDAQWPSPPLQPEGEHEPLSHPAGRGVPAPATLSHGRPCRSSSRAACPAGEEACPVEAEEEAVLHVKKGPGRLVSVRLTTAKLGPLLERKDVGCDSRVRGIRQPRSTCGARGKHCSRTLKPADPGHERLSATEDGASGAQLLHKAPNKAGGGFTDREPRGRAGLWERAGRLGADTLPGKPAAVPLGASHSPPTAFPYGARRQFTCVCGAYERALIACVCPVHVQTHSRVEGWPVGPQLQPPSAGLQAAVIPDVVGGTQFLNEGLLQLWPLQPGGLLHRSRKRAETVTAQWDLDPSRMRTEGGNARAPDPCSPNVPSFSSRAFDVIDTLTSASKAADFRVDCVHFKERRTSNTRNRLSELNLPPYSTAPTLYTVVAENYVPY
ncbi:hypothetical protein CB1_000896003 [Camelus ferus]|nr:hypothetical protein CB1_000896003 [Camelus ferus]